jgi:hypothetical protein
MSTEDGDPDDERQGTDPDTDDERPATATAARTAAAADDAAEVRLS